MYVVQATRAYLTRINLSLRTCGANMYPGSITQTAIRGRQEGARGSYSLEDKLSREVCVVPHSPKRAIQGSSMILGSGSSAVYWSSSSFSYYRLWGGKSPRLHYQSLARVLSLSSWYRSTFHIAALIEQIAGLRLGANNSPVSCHFCPQAWGSSRSHLRRPSLAIDPLSFALSCLIGLFRS